MIFTVRDLGFEIGPFLLEGWWALAARAVCAAVIVFAGLLVGWLLRRKIFPALQARSWHFAATPILLRSLQSPLARMAFYSGLYLALTSLPWAIPGLTKFLFTAYKIATTLLFCQGLYNASEVADLLLASCSPEIRSNKTLRSLLDTTYKVLVIILGVATCAQIVGLRRQTPQPELSLMRTSPCAVWTVYCRRESVKRSQTRRGCRASWCAGTAGAPSPRPNPDGTCR